MSLINQMLKDLEKRRSRDLETSPALSRNINWESRPANQSFQWKTAIVFIVMLTLLVVIAFLIWERSSFNEKTSARVAVVTAPAKQANSSPAKKVSKPVESRKPAEKKVATKPKVLDEVVTSRAFTEAIDTEGAIDTDIVENDILPTVVEKKVRKLSAEQKAEILYQEAYGYLQQNNPTMGKQKLLEAINTYPSHIKAREILAGINIKSGRYVDAASLLKEGVRLVPEYSLFAKLYARVLLEQNNPREAIRVLEKGATVLEVEPDYYALLAATYQRVNEHEKATRLYLQLVKLQPGAGVWWLGLGISLEKSGKEAEALEAFQRAQSTASLNPGLTRFASKRTDYLSRKLGQSK